MVEKAANQEFEALNYEEAFQQLESVIKSLEAGDQTLETALELYERGQLLIQRCMSLLDTAELRVKQISEQGLIDFTDLE
jgi:exodeoxyribonuclease VII small subunit